ncbi:MAG: Csa1 family protein [Sarcina sp.]
MRGSIKKILVVMIGLLVMMVGVKCFKGDSEVISRFNGFMKMFPSKDLMFLYDKEGGEGGWENLDYGDKGTWKVSSSFRSEDLGKYVHIILGFNKNTGEARGNFFLEYNDREEAPYPIYYDETGLHLVDDNVDDSVKEELDKFKFPIEVLSLDSSYLKSLKTLDVHYSFKPVSYRAKFRMKENDENMKKIKELYSELSIDEKECVLELQTDGRAWGVGSSIDLNLILDKNRDNTIGFSIGMDRSRDLEEVAKEETKRQEKIKEEKAKEPGVLDKFDGFIDMFSKEDLTFLYDAMPESILPSVEGIELKDGDLGTWTIVSELYTKSAKEKLGVSLEFNRNTRKATGVFTVREKNIKDDERLYTEKDYPVYYDEEGIHLINEDVPEEVKRKVENTKIGFDFIELDREYLESLEIERMYNLGESCEVKYKLERGDKNIAQIKELYPDVIIDERNCTLTLDNFLNRELSVVIDLNRRENEYSHFVGSVKFGESEK